MESLYERLSSYQEEGIYPMHMPGHKRNEALLPMPNAYSMDITEIDGFDNLHEAEEIIKESMERAARLYHSENTFYLVNGSTVGLLAGIMGGTKKGDKVLVARNCHKAVYNAMYLNELDPVYLYPEFNEDFGFYEQVDVDVIQTMLEEHPDIRLVILTSPTYEGVLSDISAIAKAVHERGIPLLVDEAHGAHLGFDPYFPKNAITCGADIVIHSVHKTMPSFTQTALLHTNGKLVDTVRIKHYLQILQSSSPSYLLMASIDRCVSFIEKEGTEFFQRYAANLQEFMEQMKQLRHLRLFSKPSRENVERDPSKIVVSVEGTDISAVWLYEELLTEYKIQLEMVSKNYVIAMTSLCDTKEGFNRLAEALLEIDSRIAKSQSMAEQNNAYHIPELKKVCSAYEALQKDYEICRMDESAGKICAEYIYLYPPGIPLTVPGEVLSEELLDAFYTYKELGLKLKGISDLSGQTIKIVKEQ